MVAVALTCPAPVLDEESYLDIAAQLPWGHPYDWWRPWPPWGAGREADAFVYAHPPLFLWWAKLWSSSGAPVRGVKIAAGLPWALLLGWSVGRLAEVTTRKPWLALAAWLTAPAVLLGLQRGLMPDLMVTALQTYAVVAWLEAGRAAAEKRGSWLRGAGVALALAALTKYPALMLVPVLLVHGRATGLLRRSGGAWVAFAVVFVGVEGWLALTYGRVHLVEVLTRAGEIPRGPLDGRALGVATRLALGVSVLPVLLPPLRRLLLPAVALAGGLVLLGAPGGTSTGRLVVLALFAVPGVVAVLAAGREWVSPAAPRADVLPRDGLLLGGWALAVVFGVVVGHNFAAPRYLLPAAAPLALILVRVVDRQPNGRALLWAGAALQGALALVVTTAEHHFFVAGEGVAGALAKQVEAPGLYTGEWSFRRRLDRAGWTFLATTTPAPGDIVAAPVESSPAELPGDWVEVGREAAGHFPVRVVDSAHGVGLYGETIGALPLGWRDGPLEEGILWQVPR